MFFWHLFFNPTTKTNFSNTTIRTPTSQNSLSSSFYNYVTRIGFRLSIGMTNTINRLTSNRNFFILYFQIESPLKLLRRPASNHNNPHIYCWDTGPQNICFLKWKFHESGKIFAPFFRTDTDCRRVGVSRFYFSASPKSLVAPFTRSKSFFYARFFITNTHTLKSIFPKRFSAALMSSEIFTAHRTREPKITETLCIQPI